MSIAPNLSILSSTRPTMSVNGISLGQLNTIRGLDISSTTGLGMSGSNVLTVNVDSVSISGTGNSAVSISTGDLNMRELSDGYETTANASGFFRFCGVPPGTNLELYAAQGEATSEIAHDSGIRPPCSRRIACRGRPERYSMTIKGAPANSSRP